ncbi:unnamed protein product [Ixodes pacificus]
MGGMTLGLHLGKPVNPTHALHFPANLACLLWPHCNNCVRRAEIQQPKVRAKVLALWRQRQGTTVRVGTGSPIFLHRGTSVSFDPSQSRHPCNKAVQRPTDLVNNNVQSLSSPESPQCMCSKWACFHSTAHTGCEGFESERRTSLLRHIRLDK